MSSEIPSTWKSYYGEEAFQDIRIYVEYGDKTPEEAVVILNLKPIPPQEKPMEPKQEGLKPSEQKIEVKIPIKEDTNKEVSKMEEKTKLFPNTDFDEAKGKGWFPKTDFPEQIEFTVPPMKGEKGSRLMSMHSDEFPGHVAYQLEGSLMNSHSETCETLDWYIGVADGGELFNKASLKEMKGFRKELGDAKEYPERKAIVEKTAKFLRGMKVQKK